MNGSLAMGVTLLVATVSGYAVWRPETSAAASTARTVPSVPAVPRVGAEEALARALFAMLDARQRSRAELAASVTPAVLAGEGAADEARAGLPRSAMSEAQRAVFGRLLERSAETLCGDAAAATLGRFEGARAGEAAFAWAGGEDPAAGAYVRLSGDGAVVEFYRAPGSSAVHAAWRDPETGSRTPWLRDQLAAGGR